jgi:hypothetical protein
MAPLLLAGTGALPLGVFLGVTGTCAILTRQGHETTVSNASGCRTIVVGSLAWQRLRGGPAVLKFAIVPILALGFALGAFWLSSRNTRAEEPSLPTCEIASALLKSGTLKPEDVYVVPASQAIAPEQAAFLGIWEGKWGDVNESVFVVNAIPGGDVKTTYVFRTVPAQRAVDPAYQFNAKGELQITVGISNFLWVLEQTPDGPILNGTLTQSGRVTGLVRMKSCSVPPEG